MYDLSYVWVWISYAAILFGLLMVVIAIFPETLWRAGFLLFGLLICGSGIFGINKYGKDTTPPPSPSPYNPVPVPTPTPVPVPQDLAMQIKAVFAGTKAEAQMLGALHTKFAEVLEFDGTRSKPKVTDTNMLAGAWGEAQRATAEKEIPGFKQRFGAFGDLCSQLMNQKQIIPVGTVLPMDAAKRAQTVRFFQDIGAVLCSMYPEAKGVGDVRVYQNSY